MVPKFKRFLKIECTVPQIRKSMTAMLHEANTSVKLLSYYVDEVRDCLSCFTSFNEEINSIILLPNSSKNIRIACSLVFREV